MLKNRVLGACLDFTNWNNNSLGTNLLVTDEDIADYSDLISLNYDPFFANNSNLGAINTNSKQAPIHYDNMEFDFETDELYNTESDVNCSNYNNSNSLIHDENANSGLLILNFHTLNLTLFFVNNQEHLPQIYFYLLTHSESLDSKKRKTNNPRLEEDGNNISSGFQNLPKLIKKFRSSIDNINFADSNDVISSVKTPLLYTSFEQTGEYSRVALTPAPLTCSKDHENERHNHDNEPGDLNEAMSQTDLEPRSIKLAKRKPTEDLSHADQDSDIESSSTLSSPRSNFSTLSHQAVKARTDTARDEVWQKLSGIEINLNNTVRGGIYFYDFN